MRPAGFGYRLHIDDTRIDPFFNDVTFSFKAACPRDIDCAPPAHECAPEPAVDFPVDYLARDFWSLRGALLEFAAQRYPDWQDRLEADVGVMLAEVMSALGDERAFAQDRVAREATLETATQRRSVPRLSRPIHYVMPDGLGAHLARRGGEHGGQSVRRNAGAGRSDGLKPAGDWCRRLRPDRSCRTARCCR